MATDTIPAETEDLEAKKAFHSGEDKYQYVAGWRELSMATTSLILWFLLFSGGTLISTSTFIQNLQVISPFTTFLGNSIVVLLFWTISNIGLLAIFASILGAFGQRTKFVSNDIPLGKMSFSTTEEQNPDLHKIHSRVVYSHYASAVMRGFGVYVFVLSGLLVLATEAIVSPDQGQYVRLAGMVSLLSFYAGYQPEVLSGLLDRVKVFLEQQPETTTTEEKEEANKKPR